MRDAINRTSAWFEDMMPSWLSQRVALVVICVGLLLVGVT